MSESLPSVANERTGWLMIFCSSIIMGWGLGGMLTVTVFLGPLEETFGWLRQEISFAYMAGNIAGGLGGILMGGWTDRHSVRPVVLSGSVIMGISYFALGLMRTRMEFYILYGFFFCGLGVAAFMVPLASNMGFWFKRNRGLAISIMLGGQSIGSGGVPYLAGFLITNYGWRDAYMALGVITWLMLIPLSFIAREPPGLLQLKDATRALSQSGGSTQKVSTRSTVSVLSFAIVGCCICMATPMVHLVPLVVGMGYTAQQGTTALGVLMIASVFGRLLFGKLLDWYGGVRGLFIASALQTVSVFWFTQVDSLTMIYVPAIVFGIGFGGIFPAYTVLVGEMIPPHQVGRSMGFVFLSGFIGMGLGGYFGGLFYDMTGDYAFSYGIAAVAGLLNLIVVGLFYLRVRAPTPVPEPASQAA